MRNLLAGSGGRLPRLAQPLLALVLMLTLAACVSAPPPANEQATPEPEAAAPRSVPVPEWANQAVMYEVNVRQYTTEGTFRAFEAHLPRLQEMGVDMLWLMPVHPISETKRNGSLGSYYAVDDYKAINPEFGTKEDFRHLVEQAHARGFKVILGLVANHTGWDHAWTANPGWYTTDEAGHIVQPPGTNWTDVADLNFDYEDMRAAMLDAMTYWVAEFDIDGYRADYASGVPKDFWEEARMALEQIKPVYMLAEDDQQITLLSRAFNANYGWQLYNMMNRLAKGIGNAEQVNKYAERLATSYPSGTYPLLFTSNHDENSWVGTEYERLGEAVEVMAVLSFTLPGMPLIYSGQEAGLDKRLLFFDKDEIAWDDLPMQGFYQQMISLKHDNPALWNGRAGGPYVSLSPDNGNVLAFSRSQQDNMVIVLLNLSGEQASTTVDLGELAGSYHLFNTDEVMELPAQQTWELEPWSYRIYTQ